MGHVMEFKRRGIMLVIASPSGAGKTSVTRKIMADDPNLGISISITTRKIRDGEVEGTHYFFRTVEEFEAMRDRGELLEWAEVHGNLYGTPRAEVDKMIAGGHDIVFDIDYQGTQQLYEKCRQDMVTVFLLPPSITELMKRLKSRAQDSDEAIARRFETARIEMEHWAEYDYVLVNEDLDKTCEQVTKILDTARIARVRQTKLSAFIKDLQSQIDNL